MSSAGFEGTKFYARPRFISAAIRREERRAELGVLDGSPTGTPPNDRLVRVWVDLQKGQLLSMPKGTPGRFISLKSLLTVDETRRSSAAASLEDHTWLLEAACDGRRGSPVAALRSRQVHASPSEDLEGAPPAGPPDRRLSTGDDQELEAPSNARSSTAYAPAERRAVHPIRGPRPEVTRALVEQLRLAAPRTRTASASLLEATCWTIGAGEAGIQLELLRAQSFESGLQREAAAAVAEMSARLASPSGHESPGYNRRRGSARRGRTGG